MRHQLGLQFRGCSCSSVTACSTRQCKKSNKCGPGCRCKNCANTPSATGTHPQTAELLSELAELKVEVLLHDNPLRREYSEVCVCVCVCVCVMKTAPLQLVMLTVMKMTCELLSLTSHTPLSRPLMSMQNLVFSLTMVGKTVGT